MTRAKRTIVGVTALTAMSASHASVHALELAPPETKAYEQGTKTPGGPDGAVPVSPAPSEEAPSSGGAAGPAATEGETARTTDAVIAVTPRETLVAISPSADLEMPGSVEADLDELYDPARLAVSSGPRPLFPGLAYPGRAGAEGWRDELEEKHGLRLAASYNQLYQHANNTLPIADGSTALGYWWSFDVLWAAVNPGTDRQGRFVLRVAQRDPFGGRTVPAAFGLSSLGSAWSNYEFTSWGGVRIEDMFWEQQIGREFSFRVGNLIAAAVYNFSRFKDARTSFTASPFAFHEVIPIPTFGFGASFRWSPANTGMYVVGTLNDMNGEPAGNRLDWSTVGKGQFFYGLEVGKRWHRADGTFDHLHVNVFHASRRSTRQADIAPNEAGWGFRVYGEKQWDKLVLFGGYTYNSAVGGGISTTVQEQVGTIGLAYMHPFDIRGEAALGFMVVKPFKDILDPFENIIPIPSFTPRTQYGFEPYWRIQLTPGLSLTPGAQFIFNPSFNPFVNSIVVPHLKFRFVL